MVNRRAADRLNGALDADAGYEIAGFLCREQLDGEDKLSLD